MDTAFINELRQKIETATDLETIMALLRDGLMEFSSKLSSEVSGLALSLGVVIGEEQWQKRCGIGITSYGPWLEDVERVLSDGIAAVNLLQRLRRMI